MKHLFMMAFFLAGVMLSAQTQMERQVIASQGASDRTERIRLDWTLGEAAVATVATPSGYLTEGFQQPALRVETIKPTAPAPIAYDIRVAPNPTSSRLAVQIPGTIQEELVWELFDLHGKSLQRRIMPEPSDGEINMSSYPDGMYLLRFSSRQGQLLQTFRIVKTR